MTVSVAANRVSPMALGARPQYPNGAVLVGFGRVGVTPARTCGTHALLKAKGIVPV